MWTFIFRRILYMIPLLFVVSLIGFFIIWVQPGDVLTGCEFSAPKEVCDAQRKQLGLDDTSVLGGLKQYGIWIRNIVCCTEAMDRTDPSRPVPWKVWSVDGNIPFIHFRPYFGESSAIRAPVTDTLFGKGGSALIYSLVIVLCTTLFVWLIAVPIGIFSATHKYSVADHSFTFLGFIGLSIADFLWALLLIWVLVAILQVGTSCTPVIEWLREIFRHGSSPCSGLGVTGLFDNEFILKDWSWDKFRNFLWHLWPVIIVVGMVNLASIMRYMRSNLLDVLSLPYVKTARAKGLTERTVIYKHSVRNAINPLITMLGYWIPLMVESMIVAAAVLGIDVVERNFLLALSTQDQPVIMTGLLFFAVILLVGNLIADILLVISDPRIRYE